MNGDVLIYNTIIEVSWEEYNKNFNNEILTIFKNSYHDDITVDIFKQKVALSVIESGIDNKLTDTVLGWLEDLKNWEKNITNKLLQQLDDIHHSNTNVTWRHILNTTQSLWNVMDDRKLLHYFSPEKISDELLNLGVDKRDLAFQNWRLVNQGNIDVYLREIITSYPPEDIIYPKLDQYKLFSLRLKDYRERRIFIVALHKKTQKITYQLQDPDEENYTEQLIALSRENFLFSIRNDIQ